MNINSAPRTLPTQKFADTLVTQFSANSKDLSGSMRCLNSTGPRVHHCLCNRVREGCAAPVHFDLKPEIAVLRLMPVLPLPLLAELAIFRMTFSFVCGTRATSTICFRSVLSFFIMNDKSCVITMLLAPQSSRGLRPTPSFDQVDAMEEMSTRRALPGKHATGVIAVSIHARRLEVPLF